MKSNPSSKTNTNKQILILGGGYIGSHLNHHLIKAGYVTKVITANDVNYHDKKTFWNFVVRDFTPAYVINCSGFTGRPNVDEGESKKELCWLLNVLSPMQCADVCAANGIRYIHIGSGCIYTGYDKDYAEEDAPNFGLFDTASSFYSKTKHAFEVMSKNHPVKIIRIRMPISKLSDSRSFLTKIKNYNNIIDFKNSKTYIPDLCKFVEVLLENETLNWTSQDIYNVVNPHPLTTLEVMIIMKEFGLHNPDWKIVKINELDLKTGRSNCVLSNEKASALLTFRPESDIIKEALYG
jgi:dTDP-4-dehydrorhamnose reductase